MAKNDPPPSDEALIEKCRSELVRWIREGANEMADHELLQACHSVTVLSGQGGQGGVITTPPGSSPQEHKRSMDILCARRDSWPEPAPSGYILLPGKMSVEEWTERYVDQTNPKSRDEQ